MDVHYGITDSKSWMWPNRQASRQMSFRNADYYTGEIEYAAAVAAAAFAIKNLESSARDPRRGPRTSLEKTRSQKEPRIATRPDRGASERYTDEKIIRQVPSMRRKPTFSGSKKYPEDTQSWQPEIESQIPAFPPQPPTQFVSPPAVRVNKPIAQESEADAWEIDQLDKIRQRYEKLEKKTILPWEDNKRKQAHRKLERTQGESGKRRAKALQDYQNQIEVIKQVVEGARAQAKERRRKQEFKVKEKANKFRATGQLPRSCLCFG